MQSHWFNHKKAAQARLDALRRNPVQAIKQPAAQPLTRLDCRQESEHLLAFKSPQNTLPPRKPVTVRKVFRIHDLFQAVARRFQ